MGILMNPYLAPQRIHAALRALDLRPTRGMGQNFLIDAVALAAIVDAAELQPTDLAVEVGPGLGVLTWELVRRAGAVVAVELDKRLAARLHDEFPDERLRIVQGDILRLPPGGLLTGPRDKGTKGQGDARPGYKLVANLPYAITAPVLRHFLEAEAPPELMVVLVQWEVAERIVAHSSAHPQERRYSVLAHSVQIYAEPEIVARVPAASFLPAPAVDSAVLRLRRRPRPAVEVDSIPALFRVIKAGFLLPRKQLGNALPGGMAAMGTPIDRDTALAALAAAGVAPERRAETVSLAEWAVVYATLGQR